MQALETTAEEQAREEEKQRKLKLIREGAGYVHKELVKAGLISEDTDLMEGLTYKQFRDEIADERLKEYRHQSDYARYLEKERSLS